MRISVEHDDPDFIGLASRDLYLVYLDGKRMHFVISADDAANEVHVAKTSENGGLMLSPDGDTILTEKKRGLVQIIVG